MAKLNKERLERAEREQIGSEDLWTLLLCSLRYSLGRQSYMPSLYQDIALSHAGRLTADQCHQLAQETEEFLKRRSDVDLYGFQDIRDSWDAFARRMREAANG